MKKKKGFTLVELLAVIAILAILVIIALPNVINMYTKAQKEAFLTETKKVYSEAEKKYISSSISGSPIKVINSANDSKLDMTGEKLQYCIILDNNGKVKSMKVSNGKWVASLDNNKSIEDLSIGDLEEGNLDDYKCGSVGPKTFSDDSWKTIVDAVRSGKTEKYNVGDTKEVDLGAFGKHNVRIANKSTPSECSIDGFSQTACGFVLEFVDVITLYAMNSSDTNVGGWPRTNMRTYINNDIYNTLPVELRNEIIDTKVVSGYGSKDTNSFESLDKLYLLSTKEVYGKDGISYDTANGDTITRQLDYYKSNNVSTSNYSNALKNYGAKDVMWWLRSAYSSNSNSFYYINMYADWISYTANYNFGVSPAFRIGEYYTNN